MSTVVRTEFGNYEIYNGGDIFSISPELQRIIGDVSPRNKREMEQILRDIRRGYNARIEREASVSRQNRMRMERQMEELRAQFANGIREARQAADERLRRRITEAEQRTNNRINAARQETSRLVNDLRTETRQQLADIRRQQTQAISSLERRVHNDMANMRDELDSRIEHLDRNMMQIQSDLLGRISDTNQRLDDTNRHVEIVSQGLTQLSDYVGEMENRIDENFRQQEQEIRNVQNQVRSIQEQMAKADVRGAERAKLALALLEEVEKNNSLDRFVHEEAEKVRRRMQALSNTEASGAELSSAANEAMLQITELELECNRERLKYEQKEEMTRTMLEAVLQTVDQMREIKLADDNGDPITVENNWWSRGRYGELEARLKKLQTELDEHGPVDMTMERLDEIQKEIVQGEVDIQEITNQSVARVILSQARMQAVSDIISVMEDQHWTVIEENGEEAIDYAGGAEPSDFREGAFARLRNDMGEEVTIIVDPNDDDTKNTLGFHFSGNHVDTDEENERKTSVVAEEIKKSGYEVGVPQCAGHQPMPEMESASEMTREGASKRMRERMKQQQ